MKSTRRARGLTICGLVVAIGLVGSLGSGAYHMVASQRAQDRLDTIVRNLAEIDVAANQWRHDHQDAAVIQSDIDGSRGTGKYIQWPTGPVAGDYEIGRQISTPEHTTPIIATYNGGSKGTMNRAEWLATCSDNPVGCGL